jgi:hypothetical protein
MLLDAHLLKAATPTVNMGNRIGRECQDATALEASVVWVDGLVPMSRYIAAFTQTDVSVPCFVKWIKQERDTSISRAAVFTGEVSVNVGLEVK